MLSPELTQLAREAGGDAILLDARRGRALVAEYSELITVLKNLRNAGFTRVIDFSGMHLGKNKHGLEEFQLYLTLRAPDHGHGGLTLKWKYPAPPVKTPEPATGTTPQPEDDGPVAPEVDPALAALGVSAHAIGAPQSGDGNGTPDTITEPEPEEVEQIDPAMVAPHPTLSRIWPAAGFCEREIWEMLGIPFSGNDNLKPLLLDEQFPGYPLRRDFESPQRGDFAAGLLQERSEAAVMRSLDYPVPEKTQATERNNNGEAGGGSA